MVCSEERQPQRFPFDIQHRHVVTYKSESSRDFEQLRNKISERIVALLEKSERLRQLAESDPVALREGMSQMELAVLAVLAGESALPGSSANVSFLQRDVERAGFTSVGFGLGLRRLLRAELVESSEEQDEEGYRYPVASLTQAGWDWVEQNEAMFVTKKQLAPRPPSDEIPF